MKKLLLMTFITQLAYASDQQSNQSLLEEDSPARSCIRCCKITSYLAACVSLPITACALLMHKNGPAHPYLASAPYLFPSSCAAYIASEVLEEKSR